MEDYRFKDKYDIQVFYSSLSAWPRFSWVKILNLETGEYLDGTFETIGAAYWHLRGLECLEERCKK